MLTKKYAVRNVRFSVRKSYLYDNAVKVTIKYWQFGLEYAFLRNFMPHITAKKEPEK